MSVDVPMISELPKLFEAFPMVFDRIETRHFSTFWYSYDSYSTLRAVYLNIFKGIELNLNKLSGFVSQAWEIVLDAWDWCLWSTGVRLTKLAGKVMTMVMMMIMMTTTCKVVFSLISKAFAETTSQNFKPCVGTNSHTMALLNQYNFYFFNFLQPDLPWVTCLLKV